MATRWARFARGWMIAAVSTLVAAFSHTLGGGGAPGPLAVVLSLAFAGVLCIGLAGRTLSLARVGLSVLLSQAIFHGLFSLGGPGGLIQTDAAAPALHEHAAAAGSLALTGASNAARDVHLGHASASMWLGHLAAAAVTVAALRYGERAFWGLFESARLGIRCLVATLPAVIVPAALRRTAVSTPVFTARDLGVLLLTDPHRGPPAALFA